MNNINKEKNSSRQKSVGNGFHFDNFHNKSKLENTNLSVQTGISEKNFQEIIKDKDKEIDDLKKELENLKNILKKKQRLSVSSTSSKIKNNSNINLTLKNKIFNNNNSNKNSTSLNEEKIAQQNSFLKGFHSTKAASITKINYHSSKNTINTIHKTNKNKQNDKKNNNYNSNNNKKLSFENKKYDNENNYKNNHYKIELDKLKTKTQNLLERYKILSNN